MQGTHAFQADAKSEIDLESLVAEDHMLRTVDRVLDLAFVRELTAPCYSQLGAPSIDPEVFFRMLLVGTRVDSHIDVVTFAHWFFLPVLECAATLGACESRRL